MNSIPKTPGIYILVFQLSEKSIISFNRKGSQCSFTPGWYLYVGSACGSGGLNRRVTRHRRRHASGKRMHWNVDYFREHATLCEIWFRETRNSDVEHQWAQSITEQIGVSVPVRKFGAHDCEADYDAHFFYCSDRPSTVRFRSKLASRNLGTEVFVEFLKEPSSTTEPTSPLLQEYRLGRRFLELRRRATANSSLQTSKWSSLAKQRPARLLAEEVASDQQVSFLTLKRAVEFSSAIETLIENCGEAAWPVLFDTNKPQSRRAIMSLSRTSDVRQRYRINGLREGRFRSVAPQSGDIVFDTVRFGEVPSRLARARGSLEKLRGELHLTDNHDLIAEAQRLSDLCRLSSEQLAHRLNAGVDISSTVPDFLSKKTIISGLKSSDVKGSTIGKARMALRLIVKNLWDAEEMTRRGLVPSEDELCTTLCELMRIQQTAKQIECEAVTQCKTHKKETDHVDAA